MRDRIDHVAKTVKGLAKFDPYEADKILQQLISKYGRNIRLLDTLNQLIKDFPQIRKKGKDN